MIVIVACSSPTETRESRPVFVSTPAVEAHVDSLYTDTVHAHGSPAPVYRLIDYPEGMTLNSQSGEVLWTTPVFSGPAEQKWHHNSFATPTPVSDGERVFAYFGHGLASIDLDGRLEWWIEFPGYTHSTRYGSGASPVLSENAVIVVREREINQQGPASWMAAFEKTSGRSLWRIEPPRAHDSYTTPLLVENGN